MRLSTKFGKPISVYQKSRHTLKSFMPFEFLFRNIRTEEVSAGEAQHHMKPCLALHSLPKYDFADCSRQPGRHVSHHPRFECHTSDLVFSVGSHDTQSTDVDAERTQVCKTTQASRRNQLGTNGEYIRTSTMNHTREFAIGANLVKEKFRRRQSSDVETVARARQASKPVYCLSKDFDC
jgi:hypothetical protein